MKNLIFILSLIISNLVFAECDFEEYSNNKTGGSINYVEDVPIKDIQKELSLKEIPHELINSFPIEFKNKALQIKNILSSKGKKYQGYPFDANNDGLLEWIIPIGEFSKTGKSCLEVHIVDQKKHLVYEIVDSSYITLPLKFIFDKNFNLLKNDLLSIKKIHLLKTKYDKYQDLLITFNRRFLRNIPQKYRYFFTSKKNNQAILKNGINYSLYFTKEDQLIEKNEDFYAVDGLSDCHLSDPTPEYSKIIETNPSRLLLCN